MVTTTDFIAAVVGVPLPTNWWHPNEQGRGILLAVLHHTWNNASNAIKRYSFMPRGLQSNYQVCPLKSGWPLKTSANCTCFETFP